MNDLTTVNWSMADGTWRTRRLGSVDVGICLERILLDALNMKATDYNLEHSQVLVQIESFLWLGMLCSTCAVCTRMSWISKTWCGPTKSSKTVYRGLVLGLSMMRFNRTTRCGWKEWPLWKEPLREPSWSKWGRSPRRSDQYQSQLYLIHLHLLLKRQTQKYQTKPPVKKTWSS